MGAAPPPLPWAPEGRPEFNRAVFLNLLARQWLPAIADVDRRLRSTPPARVADLACGTGWSSIAMAQAYPLISVDGFDLEAGFSDLEVLPVEAGMLRFYRLDRELWRPPRAPCVLCVSWPSVIVRTCAANIGR